MTTRSHGYTKDSQRVVGPHRRHEARRSWVSQEQKALVLGDLIQRSESFQAERRKAEQDANRKRAAAASQQHAISNPQAGEKRPVLVEPQIDAAPKQRRQPSPENKTSTALAAQVGVNRAAVERADFIRKNSPALAQKVIGPALAQKVIDGEVPASAAVREIRREQKKVDLNKWYTPTEYIERVRR